MATPKYEMSAEEYRAMRDGTMTEKVWRKKVKEMAALYGWEVLLEIPDNAYRVLAKAAKTDKGLLETMAAIRGWPDLFLGNRKLRQNMFLELKTETGGPNDNQRQKLPQLWGCGMSGGYWQPSEHDALEQLLIVGIQRE